MVEGYCGFRPAQSSACHAPFGHKRDLGPGTPKPVSPRIRARRLSGAAKDQRVKTGVLFHGDKQLTSGVRNEPLNNIFCPGFHPRGKNRG